MRLSHRIIRLCLTELFFLLSCAVSHAQVNNVAADQQTPTPGVGHDYVHLLAETVDPSMGSLSIRINVPTPKGRGLTIPFAFAYDSSGTHFPHSIPTTNGEVGWLTSAGILSQGGWSYSLPTITWADGFDNDTFGNRCRWTSNYVFQDVSGGRHALGLGTAVDSPQGSGTCSGFSRVNVLAGGDALFSATPTLMVDRDGTVYNFSIPSMSGSAGPGTVQLAPSLIEDRNGNKIAIAGTISNTFTMTDTAGRPVVSTNGFGVSGNTVTVSGLANPYVVNWGTANSNFTVGISQYPNCPQAFPSNSGSQAVIRSITLPNGQSYTFTYDSDDASIPHPFGLITKITYPTGGWVKYTWKLNLLATRGIFNDQGTLTITPVCPLQYDTPAVATRTVSFDGQKAAMVQAFSYSTVWPTSSYTWSTKQTVVTNQDALRGGYFQTYYAYIPFPIPDSPNDPFPACGNFSCNPVPVENKITYKDWNGSVLRTITKAWLNQYLLTDETTQLGTGTTAPTSSVHYSYYPAAQGYQLQEKDEYDFGSGTKGILARKTAITYANFPSTPIYPTAPSIFDKPATVIVYDGNGIKFSETDYAYDQTTVGSVSNLSNVSHDETNYSATSTATRGNATTVTHKCLQTCADATTTYTFDETGQVLTSKDPCGNSSCGDIGGTSHTTTYSYLDYYDSPPATNTNTYRTKITNALGQSSAFKYAYSDGQLIQSQDQNDINASRSGTTYFYNDSLRRLTETDFPDGGQTLISYNDSAPSPSLTTTKKITSTVNLTAVATMDGLGHHVKTQLTSDPDGVTSTDITVDGLGRIWKQTNPYRGTGESTYGVTTTYFDALGRTCLVVPPDGTLPAGVTCPTTQPSNTILTTYLGNTVTVTDQAGISRRSVTDGLGRLTQVFEDPAVLKYETDYLYDALDNLLSVNQKGGSTNSTQWRTRLFTYDSLSRLLTAKNPESGTSSYTYDALGNLSFKTSPAPNQTGTLSVTLTYCYDVLNRLTAKAYTQQTCSNGTLPSPVATYLYDQTSNKGLTIVNSIGRRTGMTDSAGAEAWSYDTMGRIATDQRTTNALTRSYLYSYNLDGSLFTTTHPDGLVVTFQPGGAGRPLSETSGDDSYAVYVHYAPNGSVCYRKQYWGQESTVDNTFNNRFQPVRVYMQMDYNFPPPAPCTTPTQTSNIQLDFTYSFVDANGHNNGNVASIAMNSDTTRSQKFSYDSLNRISTAQTLVTYANGPTRCWGEQFGYDPWGNLLSISGVSTAYNGCTQENLSVAVNIKNQIVGNTYDAAGNLFIAQPGNVQYNYDAENHLISTAGQTYLYDGDGKRVEKATSGTPVVPNKLYWYGAEDSPVLETDPAGNELYRYFRFLGTLVAREEANDWVDHYGVDALGNVRFLYGFNGAEDDSDYYPFGGERAVLSGNNNNTRKFTGKERDPESGLDNFGARYNSSSMGRFMSPDPINLTAGRLVNPANALNKYVYGGNNPLLYVDPDGLDITVFYRQGQLGNLKDYGHIFIAATNQQTGKVKFLDYYPLGSKTVLNRNMTAERLNQHAAITIQTTPEVAQKLIDYITKLEDNTPDYDAINNNCATICQQAMAMVGIDLAGGIFPGDLWNALYAQYSDEALSDREQLGNPFFAPLPRYQPGVDFGRTSFLQRGSGFSVFDLFSLMLRTHSNNGTACVATEGPKGLETTCEH